ncbi:MAG: hypothetical protein GY835_00290 [bacterium]|nr:hypothetical protein [bacterium]
MSIRLFAVLSTLIILLWAVCPCAVTAQTESVSPGWRIDGELWTAWQGYVSGELNESMWASELEVQAEHLNEEGGISSLRLNCRDDLYTRIANALVNGRLLTERLSFTYEAWFERNEAGQLDKHLLFFDPGSILGTSLANFDSDMFRVNAGLAMGTPGWDANVNMGWCGSRFDRPGEYTSDHNEVEIDGLLSLLLAGDARLEIDMEYVGTTYLQRAASNASELYTSCRLSKSIGLTWDLGLAGWRRGRSVEDESEIQYYECPGGAAMAGGIVLDLFPVSELFCSLEYEYGREDWDLYEGYYVDGLFQDLELGGCYYPSDDSSLEFNGSIASFEPKTPPIDNWSISHGNELQVEGSILYRHGGDSRIPLGCELSLEEHSLGNEEVDRFRYLRAAGDLGWRITDAWFCGLCADIERYTTEYAGESAERELGFGVEIDIEYRSDAWLVQAHAQNRTFYSFLEEDGEIRDGEIGLRICWNP